MTYQENVIVEIMLILCAVTLRKLSILCLINNYYINYLKISGFAKFELQLMDCRYLIFVGVRYLYI